MFTSKTSLIDAFVDQQLFGISSRNLDTCIFMISSVCILNHIALSAVVMAVLR